MTTPAKPEKAAPVEKAARAEEVAVVAMTDDQRAALWKQYAAVHAHAQETFDSSVRTLAAAGVAATVAIVTALKEISPSGVVAVVLFLVSLGANLLSYVSAQMDVKKRMTYVIIGDWRARDGNFWTGWTVVFNWIAGSALLAAGGFLAYYVASSV